ncbi:hypothetical protein LHK_02807 [Laribacter hongkongensis HLHK9]|uniref:Uncharacterized protein n=1 Tax=Laribacter hongkongensis (strain HLHK9) TaxID=557598 RepID=C1DDF5_LARHH|nr:hypothetical protein LHK_02807 [Laribacter hongkongensis HLHK9]
MKTACTDATIAAGTDESPQIFRHGLEQPGQIFSGLEHLGQPSTYR